MKSPTLREEIKAIRLQADVLVRSYTDLIGSKTGQIRSKTIRREVQCLRAAIARLSRKKTFDVALKQLRLRIEAVAREHGACERQIKRLETRKRALFRESRRLWTIVDAASDPAGKREK